MNWLFLIAIWIPIVALAFSIFTMQWMQNRLNKVVYERINLHREMIESIMRLLSAKVCEAPQSTAEQSTASHEKP